MTPSDEAAALLANWEGVAEDVHLYVPLRLLRALLDEQTRLTEKYDDAMDQLRTICRSLPQPPWYEERGGADWSEWCQWITEEITRLREALAKERQTEKTKT